MKNDGTLQQDVQDALKWEPFLQAANIGVIASDGIVTLTGVVDSYAKKREAEEAAKRVAGVKVVVEEITVELSNAGKRTDTQVATDIISAFRFNWAIPNDEIYVTVEHGWVTLAGEVEWNYQSKAARKTVKHLAGVKGVTNNLTINTTLYDALQQMDIEQALSRNWAIDSEQIDVAVSGNHITLNGRVDSIYQRDEAGRIAWNAPGVETVDNELVIAHDLYFKSAQSRGVSGPVVNQIYW